MIGEDLAGLGPTVVSMLALVLALLNLYLQRKDRSPRLRIRMRYEYQADYPETGLEDGHSVPQMYDEAQQGLYMRLGDFLREHGLDYPRGSPLVRFAISNEGDKVAYLGAVRLVFRESWPFGRLMVLDPAEDRVLPLDLAQDTANVVGAGASPPVEIVPGDGVGYRFSLIRLANTLEREGHAGDIHLSLEVTDRLGNIYRRPFRVDTDLWAYQEDPDS